ncbi:MAG: NAD-dependent epimerase/dehydratase family protein [Bacteroidota bacterium]
MPKRILITGGAGFIPSSLGEALANLPNYQVVLVDNMLTGKQKHIPQKENVHFIKADVNDIHAISAIMTSYKFDAVFHYAAVVGVLRTLKHPSLVLKDIDGIRNILELSKNTGVKRVFYSSSSEVYGEPVELPQHEESTPLNSRLPYAVVKNVGESFFRTYKQEFNLDYTIFRFFNTYGPKQSDDFVVSKFIKAALRNDDITIYGDGFQTRTFCYINDNVDFTIKVLEGRYLLNEVVNVGHDKQFTILELAETIKKVFGSSSKIVHLPALAEGDMKRRQPDNSKMRSILNRNLLDLEKGLKLIRDNKVITV